MKHKGLTLIELLIIIFIICVLAAVFFPFIGHHHSPHNARRARCQSHLKQIGLAFMQYTQDYNEQFPRIAMNNVMTSNQPFNKPFGWADALYPYLKTTQIFQCPADTANIATDATQQGFTDYWMNANLAQLNINKIQEPAQTLLSGDGNDGTDSTNARYNINALPVSWRIDQSKPSFRHLGGGNYLFADGHVKYFKPSQIQNKSNKIGAPTFAIK